MFGVRSFAVPVVDAVRPLSTLSLRSVDLVADEISLTLYVLVLQHLAKTMFDVQNHVWWSME